MTRRGLALLVVAGILGLLAVLASVFVILARLERRSAVQRVHATKALLLARSGLEDAAGRVVNGQDPLLPGSAYRGEDWDGDGFVTGLEATAEAFQPGTANLDDCPARHAMAPSFYRKHPTDLDAYGKAPKRLLLDGRERGLSSGALDGSYALKVRDLNSRIHVNDGSLTASTDIAPDGPNGFLVRLLDNLNEALTGSGGLGAQVVAARPAGGYRRLEDLKPVLGASRYAFFRPYLTVRAWADPKVVKPQPVDGRPNRFLDVDAAHQADGSASGGPAGSGDPTVYTYAWERAYLYAWRQLRLGPVELQPRAPIALNSASEPVLAAVLRGLRGTYLETWDGAGGWDGGFGFASMMAGGVPYPYPNDATDTTPWHRTQVDYGSPYGTAARPWYGPRTYVPPANGKSIPYTLPLGRLRESSPVSLDQAKSIAHEIRERVRQKGPFRTWTEFSAFVDALPRWEDLNGDLALDGPVYPVAGSSTSYSRRRFDREDANSDGAMNREIFTVASGSWASDNVAWKDLGASAPGSLDVPGLTFVQKDAIKAMANPNTDLNDYNPDANLFKEIDKTDLLEHTTELALDPCGFVEVTACGRVAEPKTNRLFTQRTLAGEARLFDLHRQTTQADFLAEAASGTPLSEIFQGPPAPGVLAGNQPLVSHPEPQTLPPADYDGQIGLGFYGVQNPPATWVSSDWTPDERLAGDLFQTFDATNLSDAHVPDAWGPFDAPLTGSTPTVGNLFADGAYSEKDAALKFPVLGNLVKKPWSGWNSHPLAQETYLFYIACWVKVNWRPEASPRPHALISLSRASAKALGGLTGGGDFCPFDINVIRDPCLNNIPVGPFGLYFVPARNNQELASLPVYSHSPLSTKGTGWPARSLIWGATHGLYISDAVNRSGQGFPETAGPTAIQAYPRGRLEGRRWQSIACIGKTGMEDHYLVVDPNGKNPSARMVLGRHRGSAAPNGGGWNNGFGRAQEGIREFHKEDPTDPNHLRFGEVAGEVNMNYVADATFANVRTGGRIAYNHLLTFDPILQAYEDFFTGPNGPGTLGRYYKEGDYLGNGASFTAPRLPAAAKVPLRITWTEIPADLWFDQGTNAAPPAAPVAPADGWADTLANDQFGSGGAAGKDGLRDVRIRMEVWDDRGTASAADDVLLASFDDAGGPNRVPAPKGRLYCRAVFVNDWNAKTRSNEPLDVTPFLDDVTVSVLPQGGVAWMEWQGGEDLE